MYRQFLRSVQHFETDEFTTLHSLQSIDDHPRPSRKAKSISIHQERAIAKMTNVLQKRVRNRKCYCLQLFKQFLLFPESDISSSCISVSKYDPLLFTDQKIHSLFKIMETQHTQRKIWAFINLKMHRKSQNIKIGVENVQVVAKKVTLLQKEESFTLIKQVSYMKKRQQKLGNASIISIAINSTAPRPPQMDFVQRQVKLQVSTSKRTAAESERQLMFSRQRDCPASFCQFCCCECCYCCCEKNDNLWQRIQYLQHLQQMLRQRERAQTYSDC